MVERYFGPIVDPRQPPAGTVVGIQKVIEFFKTNTWPAALFVCFMCIGLASFRLLMKPTRAEQLHEKVEQLSDNVYDGFLHMSVPAAAAGKNVFETPHNLSEDCVRTARVILQFFAKPSTFVKGLSIIHASYNKVTRAKSTGDFHSRVRTICQHLNEEALKWPTHFPNFDELKKNVELPRPKKNYIYAVPIDRNITEYLNSTSVDLEDADTFKYETVYRFHKYLVENSDVNNLDHKGTVKAIDKLSENAAYKSTVDSVFVRALEDFADEILPLLVDKENVANSGTFAKRVDQYFLKNRLLKEEYKKAKQQAIHEVQNANSND